jgi:hypothetical protein
VKSRKKGAKGLVMISRREKNKERDNEKKAWKEPEGFHVSTTKIT